jgi:pilus assembly protein FimV
VKKQALSIAVMIAGAYPAASSALSLGDIESNSNLNQPLRAKIELLAAGAQDAKQLQVRLAPASVFNRVGIDRPAFLDSLRFSTSVQNGKPVILVSSDKPITEPFVNFLLEVSWPQGQLLKEYTVMLDPPVLMQPGNTVAGNEAAVRAEPRANGTVNRPAPAPVPAPAEPQVLAEAEPAAQPVPQTARQVRVQQQRRAAPNRQAAQQPRATAPAQGGGSRTYRVRPGDTLFKVASQLSQPGTNIDQMMMALYRANPQAFIDGNINGLKSGVTLKAPAARSAKSVSRAEARRQVRQHYVDWKNIRTTPVAKSEANNTAKTERNPARPSDENARLEVLGSKQSAGANDKVTAGAGKERLAELEKELALARESLSSQQRENVDLKSRVDELESMLRKKNRLITLRDEQLSELQKSMNGGKPVAGQTQAQTPTPTVPAEATTEPKPAEPTPVPTEQNNGSPLINQQAPSDSVPAQSDGSDIQNYLGGANPNNNEVVRADPNQQQQAGMNNNANGSTANTDGNMTPAERAAAAAAALGNGLSNPTNGNVNNVAPNPNAGANPAEPIAPTPAEPVVPTQQGNTPAVEPAPANPVAPAEPKPAPQLTNPTPAAQDNDLMSMLTSPLAWKIGAGALLSLLLLALLARFLGKRKSTPPREPAFNEAEFDLSDDNIPPVHAGNVSGNVDFSDLGKQLDKAEQTKRPAFDSLDDDPFGVNLGNTHGGSVNTPAPAVNNIKADQTQPDDEDEVLMEANVYIAYGLHQQAESELKKALEKNPDRLEYRHKLLENYFAANNREAFDEQAQLFANSRNVDRQGKLWKDVMTWGSKISPDNSLYGNNSSSGLGKLATTGAAVTAAVAGAAGLAASKVQADDTTAFSNELAPSDANNISLKDDLAAALSALDDDDLTSADATHDDDFDFDLGEFDQELNSKQFDNNATDAAYTRSGRQDFQEAETALLADDDLDFNLDDLVGNHTQEVSTPKAEHTAHDDLDNLASFDFDEPLDLDQPAAVAAKAPEQPKDDFDEDMMLAMDFDELTAHVDAPKVEEPMPDFDEANNVLDFDLDQLTMDDEPVSATGKAAVAAAAGAVTKAADNVTSLNLHLDKDSGIKKILPQDTFYTAPDAVPANPDDDWLGDIDEALSFLDMPEEELDLHEAHISTKLDLARAYLDMGDIEGARSTLEEVMVEGNDNQRREAETLLHQTG